MGNYKCDDYIPLSVREEALRENISRAFQGADFSKEFGDANARLSTLSTAQERFKPEWGKIPTYRDAKSINPDLTPIIHFNQHWHEYLGAGILFKLWVKEYDSRFLGNLESYCREKKIDMDENGLRVPALRSYNDEAVALLDIVAGEQCVTAVVTRRSKNRITKNPK